jgi:hypothetical protein
VISKYVKNWGLGFSSKEPLEAFFGFDAKTIKTLATAEVKAEIEAKAAKKKPEKVAAKDHTDPTHVDSAKEASKTKAADKIAKGKVSSSKKEDWKATADAGEFDAQVTKAKAGVPWAEILGPMPAEGTKPRKAWDALRVKIWKAAKKTKGAK